MECGSRKGFCRRRRGRKGGVKGFSAENGKGEKTSILGSADDDDDSDQRRRWLAIKGNGKEEGRGRVWLWFSPTTKRGGGEKGFSSFFPLTRSLSSQSPEKKLRISAFSFFPSSPTPNVAADSEFLPKLFMFLLVFLSIPSVTVATKCPQEA